MSAYSSLQTRVQGWITGLEFGHVYCIERTMIQCMVPWGSRRLHDLVWLIGVRIRVGRSCRSPYKGKGRKNPCVWAFWSGLKGQTHKAITLSHNGMDIE
jgi:hypothetical protein